MSDKFKLFFFIFLSQFCIAQNVDTVSIDEKFEILIQTAKKEQHSKSDSLLKELELIELKYKQLNNKKALALSKFWMGRLNYSLVNKKEAQINFGESLDLSKELNDTLMIMKNYYGVGACLNLDNKYLESSQIFLQGLEYATLIKDTVYIMTYYQGIAYQFKRLGIPEKNIQYTLKSLEIAEAINDTNSIIYFNISLFEEKQHKNRYDHIKNLEPLVLEYNNVNTTLVFYDTYSKYLLEIGDLNKAKTYIDKALLITVKLGSKRMALICNTTAGEVYKTLKDYENSSFYYFRALNIAKEYGFHLEEINLYKDVSQLYELKGEYKKAFKFSKLYINDNDSLTKKNKLKEVANATEKFESIQKDKELTSHKLKIIDQENEVLKHQRSKISLIIFSVSLLLLIVIILLLSKYRQALKNKEIEKLNIKNEIIQLNALIEGEEKERKRIAQDLHDGISGDLSAIKYKIDAFTKYELTPKKHLQLKDSLNMIDQTIDQVRSISHDLAPPILRDMKLNKAIWQYCNRISNDDLEVNYQYFGPEDVLNANKETAIYRIIQELVNNTRKHAEASYCLVEIHVYNDSIHIMVEDDGKGIKNLENNSGLGMSNINSRVLYLNANLDIDTSDEGTTVTIDLKL